jgi:predicted HicB family RNase H-like nuclease
MAKSKAKQALEFARQVRDREDATWIDLHNALFGIGGKLFELFPTDRDRSAFMKTDEYDALHEMISEMRAERGDPPPLAERLSSAAGHISVRMPASIHAALIAEADAEGVSLNQLCVAKLCVQLRAAVSRS